MLPDGYLIAPVACKPVESLYRSISAGSQLAFTLRANTTRKVGTTSKAQRLSGVKKSNGPRDCLRTAEQQVEWLHRKGMDCGFEVLQVETRSERICGQQGKEKGGNNLTLQGAEFTGVIKVIDAANLFESLRKGIGPGKAYGFGLLSVASSRRT